MTIFYITKPLAMLLALALQSETAAVLGMLTQGLSLGLYILMNMRNNSWTGPHHSAKKQ